MQIQLPQPKCLSHDLPATHMCIKHRLQRMCHKCYQEGECLPHADKVATIPNMAQGLVAQANLLGTTMKQANERHEYLRIVSQDILVYRKKDQDGLLRKLVETLKAESQAFRIKRKRISQLRNTVDQAADVIDYFAALRQNELIELKLQVSSQKGLRNFKAKWVKLNQCTRKWHVEELRATEASLNEEERQMEQAYSHSLINKVKGLLSTRLLLKQSKLSEGKENASQNI